MLFLTLRDLQHRAVSTAAVSTVVGLILTLLFLMTGLVHQLEREPYVAASSLGATSWIVRSGVSGPFTAVSTLPAGLSAEVGPGASDVVLARATLGLGDGTTEVVLIGHEIDRLGQPPVSTGRAVTGPGEIVLDRTAGVELGATVQLGDTPYTVVGWSDDTTVLAGLPLAFVELGQAQDLVYGNRDSISMVLSPDTIDIAPEGTTVLTEDEVGADTLGPIESAAASIDLIRALLWCVAAIVVGAVVYLGVVERTRELAVLKAFGSTSRVLAGGIALRAIVVAGVALVAGTAAATVIEPAFPLAVRLPAAAYWQIPSVMLVVATIVSLVAARRVASIDPALAFGGAR